MKVDICPPLVQCLTVLLSRRSLESIPGLLKRLQIRAQATLAGRIGSLESIPRLRNMKNEDEDEDDFFWIKTNICVPQLAMATISKRIETILR